MPFPCGEMKAASSLGITGEQPLRAVSVGNTQIRKASILNWYLLLQTLLAKHSFLAQRPPRFLKEHGCGSPPWRRLGAALILRLMSKQKSRLFSLQGLSCRFLLKLKVKTAALKDNFYSESQ